MGLRSIYLHLEYTIAFLDARLFGGAVLQHSANMLQRSVQLSIDWTQLAALGHLSSHIEAKASFRLVDGNDSRSIGGCDGGAASAVVFAHFCAAGTLRSKKSTANTHTHARLHTHTRKQTQSHTHTYTARRLVLLFYTILLCFCVTFVFLQLLFTHKHSRAHTHTNATERTWI